MVNIHLCFLDLMILKDFLVVNLVLVSIKGRTCREIGPIYICRLLDFRWDATAVKTK